MATQWKELRAELEAETRRIFTRCPDEIKRYHYGVLTHTEAGKYSLEQYFGHWVHLYAEYYYYSSDVLSSMQRLARRPDFTLEQLKAMFDDISHGWPLSLTIHGGQKSLGKYLNLMFEAVPTLETKQDFVDLVKAFQAYVNRLYWWVHWYFPWGMGVVPCHRLEEEDVQEIVRLSKTK